jgi:hypothetical protein
VADATASRPVPAPVAVRAGDVAAAMPVAAELAALMIGAHSDVMPQSPATAGLVREVPHGLLAL